MLVTVAVALFPRSRAACHKEDKSPGYHGQGNIPWNDCVKQRGGEKKAAAAAQL